MARKSNKRVETVFGKEIIVNEQYYLNNRSLPTVDSEYEWTPEMVAALARAREDIHYFAETFFTIINGNRQRECIQLREYQKRTLKSMQDYNRLLLLFRETIGQDDFDDHLRSMACELLPRPTYHHSRSQGENGEGNFLSYQVGLF